MTVEQFISDTLAVTDHLRERFGQDRIYLLGHSWGSFIGIQAAAYDHMLAAYKARGARRMVRALENAPVTMAGGTPAGYLKVRDLWRGRAFSRRFGLWEQMIAVDLARTVPRLDLPVYFLYGAYDDTCSYPLAEEYFRTLAAPLKGFYRFDRSAHSPILEDPELARTILRADVLAGTNRRSSLR